MEPGFAGADARTHKTFTSDEPSFVGGQHPSAHPAPLSPRKKGRLGSETAILKV